MAYLSAAVPWQTIVAHFAPDLEDLVCSVHPDLAGLVIGVRAQEVVVVAHGGDGDPEGTAWRVACELAATWPGFLDEVDIGLRVVCGSVAISVGASAMIPPPADQGQAAWLAQSTISVV